MTWFFVAWSFCGYYQLLLEHLGIERWQFAYTDLGLDPVTQHWLLYFAPDRLATGGQDGREEMAVASCAAVSLLLEAIDLQVAAICELHAPEAPYIGATAATAAAAAGLRVPGGWETVRIYVSHYVIAM